MFDLEEHFKDVRYEPITGNFYFGDAQLKLCKSAKGYKSLCFKGASLLAHRLAFLKQTGRLPDADVDHINRDRRDNRWCNLREVSRQQNLFNRGKNLNKVLPKNVYLHKPSGRFRVKVKVDGKTQHYGYFDRLEDAVTRAKAVQKMLHGEFAPT